MVLCRSDSPKVSCSPAEQLRLFPRFYYFCIMCIFSFNERLDRKIINDPVGSTSFIRKLVMDFTEFKYKLEALLNK